MTVTFIQVHKETEEPIKETILQKSIGPRLTRQTKKWQLKTDKKIYMIYIHTTVYTRTFVKEVLKSK